METNTQNQQTTQFEDKKVLVNFAILKTPKKKFVFYFKNNLNVKLILSNFFKTKKPEILKKGTIELNCFLNNEDNKINFALIQVDPKFDFPTINFGFANLDKVIHFRTYTNEAIEQFKSRKHHYRDCFTLRDLSIDLVEKNTQFHNLDSLANIDSLAKNEIKINLESLEKELKK